MNLEHLFYIIYNIYYYYQIQLLLKIIHIIMLYIIDKNMKICKNLKLLESANNHDNNDDEKKKKKKKNENYNLINYISDNNFNIILTSVADSSHAISDQLLSHLIINHSDFSYNILNQSHNACSTSF